MEGWLVTTSNPPLLVRFGKPRTHHCLVGNRLPHPLVPVGLCPFTPAGFSDQQCCWKHIHPGIHPIPAGCHTPEVTQATGGLTVVQWLELDRDQKGKPVHPQQRQRKYWNPLTSHGLMYSPPSSLAANLMYQAVAALEVKISWQLWHPLQSD